MNFLEQLAEILGELYTDDVAGQVTEAYNLDAERLTSGHADELTALTTQHETGLAELNTQLATATETNTMLAGEIEALKAMNFDKLMGGVSLMDAAPTVASPVEDDNDDTDPGEVDDLPSLFEKFTVKEED